MKIRSMKLREAHKNNGVVSFCSVTYDLQGHYIVTASSSDSSIYIHDAVATSLPPKLLRNHTDGVTTLLLSPNSTCLASGSMDHSVKLYKFPGGEFQTNITRFTLPIRALAFNKPGTMLAAAGDDEGIKLINTIDGSIARLFKGHIGSVTGLSFDPKSEYMASLDSIGTLIIWELHSGLLLHKLKGIAPDTASDSSVLNVVKWSPDGEMVAVPGLKHDVVMYDRDTAEKLFSLRGDHTQRVCFLSWSPNAKYMATSGLDNQVLIWDVERKQDIDRQKFDERISSMEWKPHGNALVVIDSMGKFGVWDSPIPSSMKSPTEDIPGLQSSNGLLLFDEEGDPELSSSDSLSDIGEEIFAKSESVPTRKRIRRQSFHDEESDKEDIGIELTRSRKKSNRGQKESSEKVINAGPKMQEAFQSGATPVQSGKRHFLCYNMLGSITTMEHDGYSHIEIDFHDTGRGSRVPAMTDYFGFTMASLNENGSVFANPCKGDNNMSTLMYRPFSSWANNSEWSMRLEGEEVKAVALGSSWVAAVTSLNFLRIFTLAGLQKCVISLDGPVVTASGFNEELAVVTHSSPSLPSNEQVLEFVVFNIYKGTQTIRGRLPLTPGSCLTWFGFTDEGQLSSYDSKGVLRVFTDSYGGSWVPLFSASKSKKTGENYWVVGLNKSQLFCIVCKSPDLFPQAVPKPVLTLLDFSLPLASSDLGAENLENEFIFTSMHLCQIQRRIEEMVSTGEDTTLLDDEAFNTEAALDRCILRLIASCCNGDKLMRATELVKLLSLEKSVRGAIKLVTALKLPNLAERFNSILEERLIKEAAETRVVANNTNLTPNPEIKAAEPVVVEKITVTPPEITKTTDNRSEMAPEKPSFPLFKSTKAGKEKEKEVVKLEESIVAVKKSGEVNHVPSVRPSNPFAKSTTNNQEKSSLFDSLKKMKKNEGTSNKG